MSDEQLDHSLASNVNATTQVVIVAQLAERTGRFAQAVASARAMADSALGRFRGSSAKHDVHDAAIVYCQTLMNISTTLTEAEKTDA